jgi:hypothetical protein
MAFDYELPPIDELSLCMEVEDPDTISVDFTAESTAVPSASEADGSLFLAMSDWRLSDPEPSLPFPNPSISGKGSAGSGLGSHLSGMTRRSLTSQQKEANTRPSTLKNPIKVKGQLRQEIKRAVDKDLKDGMCDEEAEAKYRDKGIYPKTVKKIRKSGPERRQGSGRKVKNPVEEGLAMELAKQFIQESRRLPTKKEMAWLYEENIEFIPGKDKRGWADKFLGRNSDKLEEFRTMVQEKPHQG